MFRIIQWLKEVCFYLPKQYYTTYFLKRNNASDIEIYAYFKNTLHSAVSQQNIPAIRAALRWYQKINPWTMQSNTLQFLNFILIQCIITQKYKAMQAILSCCTTHEKNQLIAHHAKPILLLTAYNRKEQDQGRSLTILLEHFSIQTNHTLYEWIIKNHHTPMHDDIFGHLSISLLTVLFNRAYYSYTLSSSKLNLGYEPKNMTLLIPYAIRILRLALQAGALPSCNVFKTVCLSSNAKDINSLLQLFCINKESTLRPATIQLIKETIKDDTQIKTGESPANNNEYLFNMHKILAQYYFARKQYKLALMCVQIAQLYLPDSLLCSGLLQAIVSRIKRSIHDSLKSDNIPSHFYLSVCLEYMQPEFAQKVFEHFLQYASAQHTIVTCLKNLSNSPTVHYGKARAYAKQYWIDNYSIPCLITPETKIQAEVLLVQYYLRYNQITQAIHHAARISDKNIQKRIFMLIEESIVATLKEALLPDTVYLTAVLQYPFPNFVKYYFHQLFRREDHTIILSFLRTINTPVAAVKQAKELLTEYFLNRNNFAQSVECALQIEGSNNSGIQEYQKMVAACYLNSKNPAISILDAGLPNLSNVAIFSNPTKQVLKS